MKKTVLLLLLFLFAFNSLYALDDSLSLSNVPIIYGEEGFIRRVEEKAAGREPVGLVLTGGSARALAHIGVLKCLEENNIVPDFIIGNSMGSIVGMLYAYGLSPDQILEIFESVDIGTLFDITLPLGKGLIAADRFVDFLKLYLGENLRIEDLKIPCIAVCEDLVSKRSVLLCEGDFYDSLLASFALPVYFSSVNMEEHLLIDGAVANIAPVDFAHMYADHVIVSTTFYSNPDLNLKNPITALNAAFDIGKRRTAMAEISSHEEIVWIRCAVENFSFMQFSAGSELSQRGYDSCKEVEEYLKDFSTGIPQSLTEFRAQKQEDLRRAAARFNIYERAPSFSPSLLYPIVDGTSFKNTFYRDDSILGTGVRFSEGNFVLQASAGASFKLDNRNFYFKGMADASVSGYFLDSFCLSGDFTYFFDSDWKAVQKLCYRFSLPEPFFLEAGEKAEMAAGRDFLISLYADFSYETDAFEASMYLEGGFEGRSAYLLAKPSFGFSPSFVSAGAFLSGEVFVSEEISSYEAELNLSYLFDKEFTFGEMFIFSDTKAGVYLNAGSVLAGSGTGGGAGSGAGSGAGRFEFREAGVSFSTDMGLIGLRNVPIQVKAGYQFNTNAVHFSFEAQL